MRVVRACSVFANGGPSSCPDPRFDPVGGMQTHTGELTRALAERGVDQVVVTSRPPGTAKLSRRGRATIARVGLPLPQCRQFYGLPAARMITRAAARADLVHAHLGEDIAVVPIALAAATRYRLPLVVTVHTSVSHTLSVPGLRARPLKTLGGWWERRGERHAQAVIVLTRRLATLVTRAGVPPERVHVIPSGVRGEWFDGTGAAREGSRTVLFLGRLHRQKGVDVLLRAAALVPGVQVVLAGDGPLRPALEKLADELGIADRVRFAGFVDHDDVPGLLREAALLVMPSRYEELGTAVVEAMSCAVPVVASDIGGLPEVVEDGGSGFLVPPGDPPALADAMRLVLGDRALAERLGSRGQELARAYRWESLAGRVLDVYHEVLNWPR